ncbi:hypothetical protein TNCV_3498851 [Trichonephila clavipes]|nr:hypothetical protein TNCV_3498851 [Trichonephila clavipes]
MSKLKRPRVGLVWKSIWGDVGSLVVRASNSRPEGLDSMSEATKYPPSVTEYVLVKSVGPKSCGLSRAQGLENISLPFSSLQKLEVEIGGVAIYRPFGEFRRAKSYCHLYGAHGQRQAFF